MGEVLAALNASQAGHRRSFRVRPADLAALLNLVRDGVVSHTAAKQIFADMVATGDPPRRSPSARDSFKVSDDDAARAPGSTRSSPSIRAEAARFARRRAEAAQGVLVGFVMKKSKGRADPEARQSVAGRRGSAS